jgi:hypothetical protein
MFGSMGINLDVHVDTLNTGLVKRGIGYQQLPLAVVSTKGWLLPYFYHLVHRWTWLGSHQSCGRLTWLA